MGTDPLNAVHNAMVLEEVAFMDFHALMLEPMRGSMHQELLDKHYLRKHGPRPIMVRVEKGKPLAEEK